MNFSYAERLIKTRTETAMTSTIQIQRGALGTLDPVTLEVQGISSPTTIYSGKAHVHNVQGAGAISIGDGSIDTRTVRISYPASATMARRDDLVKIVSDDDPDLPNRVFRVMDVDVGGLLSTYHVMTCQGYFESRYWTGA